MTKSIFKSDEQRQDFMYHLGIQYASQGGLISPYSNIKEAFDKAKSSLLYRRIGFQDSDFKDFVAGFECYRELCVEILRFKADSQEAMKVIMNSIDLSDIGDKVRTYKDVNEMKEAQESSANA